MAYTTEAIVRVESAFKDSTNIDTTYVTRAIAQADSYINSEISQVYSLPLSETPSLIQELSTKCTVYNLLSDQNLSIEIAQGINVQALLDEIDTVLQAIRKREKKLIGADGLELALIDALLPSGYPNTADTDSGDAERFFTMDQQF